MSIKNWTVTTQRVKKKSEGLSEYASYLVSQKHENHKNTEIYALFNSEHNKFLNDTINEVLDFDAKNKKGGRKVESFAQSFNFILPPPHKPTPQQWQKIARDIVETIHTELSISSDLTTFGRSCFINVHDQANPHLNMLIPRIFQGQRLADLDRKNVLAKVKLQFNKSVLKHCDIDHTHHKPLRTNTGPRKNAQRYAYDKAKQEAQNALNRISDANIATADASIAEKSAENKIKALEAECLKLNFFIRAFKIFRSNLVDWVDSVRKDLALETMVNKQKLEETANKIVESKAIDDESAELVANLIDVETENLEKDNFEVSKPQVRRRIKPKAS